jgi:hypothetical protein
MWRGCAELRTRVLQLLRCTDSRSQRCRPCAAMAAPERRPVVTAFVTCAPEGAPSRILLLRRSQAVRRAGDAALCDALC